MSPNLMKIDHHVHTSRHSADSIIDPEELIASARSAGLDAVVITDHDYQWTADELAEIQERAGDLLVLSGAEVSAREGHFLVYGLPDLREAQPGITVGKLIEVVRKHDAAIVAAHPFRWFQDFRAIVHQLGPVFDALELVSNNVTTETRSDTEQLLSEFPMGATGSSDGHQPEVVGCYYTEVSGQVRSMADFVAALRAHAVRPRHREGVPLTSGPVL